MEIICLIELPNGAIKVGYPAGQDNSNPGNRCVVSEPKGAYGRRTCWSAPADKVVELDLGPTAVTVTREVYASLARKQVGALNRAGYVIQVKP